MDLQFFQFSEDFEVVQRQLPHWSQAGSLAFITFRTFDSMPRSVVRLGWQSAMTGCARTELIQTMISGKLN